MSVEQSLRDRLPPHNQEAEMCVLGAMLRNNRCIDEVLLIIRKEDFYFDANQKCFETMVALNDQGGRPVDVILLHDELQKREYLADVGGPAYLASLWDFVPSAANVEYYARIVREKALLRNLILASNEILAEAHSQTSPADQLVEQAQRKIFDLAEKGMTSHLTTLQAAIDETYQKIDERSQGLNIGIGLSTGFTDLDELTAGLHDRELVIIAARPSVGKTAFSLGLTRNIIAPEKGSRPKIPVFFVSLEQSRVEIAERLLCSQARVDSHKLRKGTLSSDDIGRMTR